MVNKDKINTLSFKKKGDPVVFRFIMVTTITYYKDDKPACSQ